MATDLETRKSPSKTEAFLRRRFADVAARIQRVDLVAHLLVLVLAILCYAVAIGVFDWFVGNSTADYVAVVRWATMGAFAALVLLILTLTVRCFFRRVNPYYVAHQLEQTLPDSKNGLINWLDLHDEELPSAFQRNLGARAAEQWKYGDADAVVTRRKNWLLLGTLGLPVLVVLILLILDPSRFLGSMRRAFWPIDAPPPIARTQLTLVDPDGGDVEVNPTQAIAFVAKIEGRVPASNRPDAPKLHWRYQDNEDWATLPLSNESGSTWNAQLEASQLRGGLTYKLSAGDAETPEHQVRVRARAHVTKFEITYQHREYRKLPKAAPTVFPNEHSARPHIHGPHGSEVEMVVRASRPVKSARVEFLVGKTSKDLPVEMKKHEPQTFACQFPLEQSGQFRVTYAARDGEENADRELYDVTVQSDELPRVILTRPGKDSEIPCNSSFVLEGKATSIFGVRGLVLHWRVPGNVPEKPLPIPYRPGKSFKLETGAYTGEIDYLEFVKLDELKINKDTMHTFAPGTVLEYWLEAADGADYPNPTGNIGKSVTYKVKLLNAIKDKKQEESKRQQAAKLKNEHKKKQDDKLAKENQQPSGQNGNDGQGSSPEQTKKEIDDAKSKLKNTLDEQPKDRGTGKGAEPQNSGSKGGESTPDAPEPQPKGDMAPDRPGESKQPEGGASGEPRDGGAPKKPEGPTEGSAKGAEQNGPDLPGQDQKTKAGTPPPDFQAKPGKLTDPNGPGTESKEGPADLAKGPGQPRGDEAKMNPKQPNWDDLAKKIQDLADKGAKGKAAAKDLAEVGKNAEDPRKSNLAKEALEKNGREPANGKKVPSPIGTAGKSPGVSDELKAAAANREFAARIGQMQLDDWKKRLTPDLLKKAGMSEAEWQRFVKNTQMYDAQVRALNAQLARKAFKELSGPRTAPPAKLTTVEGAGAQNTAPTSIAPPPPELRGAHDRFTQKRP